MPPSVQHYTRYADAVRISTLHALDKGVTTWHLVHTVRSAADMAAVVAIAKSTHVDLFYSTDVDGDWQAGHNTWGALPPYWQQEVALLDGSSEPLPACAALAAGPLDAGVIKTDWADIGKPGNIYVGARGPDGKSWMHDGLQWQHYLGATRDVFRAESLRGLVMLTNQDMARVLAGVPGTASTIWAGYALAEEPDELRSRRRLCTLR